MYGKGLIKGLGVTFARYWNTYWEDITWFVGRKGKRYFSAEGVAHRSSILRHFLESIRLQHLAYQDGYLRAVDLGYTAF